VIYTLDWRIGGFKCQQKEAHKPNPLIPRPLTVFASSLYHPRLLILAFLSDRFARFPNFLIGNDFMIVR
jgi:hypothetical protein